MGMINYKGKEYPVRTFTMTSEETGEVTYTIADDTLSEAMRKNSPHLKAPTERSIDEGIYFYVEAGVLDLPAEEICKKHLDIEFELIEDEDE